MGDALLPLRTERLLLRPYEDGDLEALYEMHRREDVTRYLPWSIRSLEEARAMLDRRKVLRRFEEDGDGLVLALVLPETSTVVGDVDLQLRSVEHKQGEIGYVLRPDAWGQGYATEAAAAMLRLGFEAFGLHRIVGRIDARNEASARVLERLGMRREAHFRENEFLKGEWTDEFVYAILSREWRP